jgi:hypothetical protein
MHRLKLVGLALIAVLAVGVTTAASAMAALPEVLLLGTEKFPVAFEGTSGKGKLVTVGGKEIKCTKGKNSGSVTGAKTGTATLTFEGCESSGFKCNTAGKGAGIVESTGSTTLVFDSLTTLGVAELLAVNETTIECTSLVKIKVKGNILLLVLPINSEVTVITFDVSQTGGKPTDSTYWEGGVEKHPQLLTSINGGAFEESGDTSEENKATTAKMIEVMG